MKQQIIGFLFCILLLTPVLSINAATVSGLYEAEAPAYGLNREARRDAMQLALQEVMVRVTGDRNVALVPGITQALKNPASFVQQFRFQNLKPDQIDLTAGKRPIKAMWVSFDARAVDKLLQANGLPVWGRSRPSVLVWLALEQEGERTLLAADQSGPIVQSLKSVASRRGLPLILPLMDLQDQASVKVLDVWGGFLEELTQASARYETEAVLVGRISALPEERWLARWTLILNNETSSWDSEGDKLALVVGDGVEGSADVLGRRYAQFVGEGAPDTVLVRVEDLHSLQDYRRVEKYLQSLTLVNELQATRVGPNMMEFAVTLKGEPAGFSQAIGLGRVLLPVGAVNQEGADPLASEPIQQVFAYRLLP